jgi:protein tyrosine/serine phosphatase
MRVLNTIKQTRLGSSQTLVAVIVCLLLGSAAAAKNPESFGNVRIKNFGQMDEHFFRGAQPNEGDFQSLASIGIKTVIDLRDDPVSYEKRSVEALGMRYVNIPMSDTSYPSDGQIANFLKLANDPATGKFYVHCAGGRHRTGVMGAVYRYNVNQWDYDKVYKEMKAYDFYTRWGHGAMKGYVEDYWHRIQNKEIIVQAK